MAFVTGSSIRYPRKLPKAVVGAGGGVGQASSKPAPTTPDYISIPPFLADPSIEAQRRAAARGLEDTEENVKTETHFAENDLAHALAKLKTHDVRSRQDIARTSERGNRTLSNQEADLNTKGQRANEDFDTQLANIGRQFAQLGHRQGEAANAAGVLDAGTSAASAAARGQNQGFAEAPINTARGRLGEDLATALGRIGTSRTELGEDEGRQLTRLGQDTTREEKQAKRDTYRKTGTPGPGGFIGEYGRELGRARREGKIAEADLLEQEIYAARQENPAAFRQWAKEHPGIMDSVQGKGGGSGSGGNRGGGASTGGTSAPGNKKKKGGR